MICFNCNFKAEYVQMLNLQVYLELQFVSIASLRDYRCVGFVLIYSSCAQKDESIK